MTEIDHVNRRSAADSESNRNPRRDKHLRARDFHDPRQCLISGQGPTVTYCTEIKGTPYCTENKGTLRYAYFPTDSFVSLISVIDGSPGIEVGMVGSEGLAGAHLALGIVKAPLHGLVQGDGVAHQGCRPARRARKERVFESHAPTDELVTASVRSRLVNREQIGHLVEAQGA